MSRNNRRVGCVGLAGITEEEGQEQIQQRNQGMAQRLQAAASAWLNGIRKDSKVWRGVSSSVSI